MHTDIGNSCVACRVDRDLAPLSSQLQSGQTVEIITAKDARPNPDWLTFTVSGKARTAIRQALKDQKRSQSIALGRRLLNRSLANADTSINDLDFRRLRKVLKEFNVRRLNDLLEAIGLGNYMAYVVAQRLLAPDNPAADAISIQTGGPVAIRGTEGLVISYGRCCYPVPGDPIAGHMSSGKGFVVHIETCKNMAEIRRRSPNEIIPARWAADVEGEYVTALAHSGRSSEGRHRRDRSDDQRSRRRHRKHQSRRTRRGALHRGGRVVGAQQNAPRARHAPAPRPDQRSRHQQDHRMSGDSRSIIATPNAPAAIGTYSQAVRIGNTVYLSGQIALDPATTQLVGPDIDQQIHQVFKNLRAVVTAAGGGFRTRREAHRLSSPR